MVPERAWLRVLGVGSLLVAATALVAYILGGEPWLTSPALWGSLAVVAIGAIVLVRLGRGSPWTIVVALPIVAGATAAVASGAADFLDVLTSPWLLGGVIVSGGAAVWAVRTGRVGTPRALEGMLLGVVVFALALLLVYAGIVFFAMIWQA